MFRSASGFARLLGPLSVAASLGFGTLPAFAQAAPTTSTACGTLDFQLANPSPGSRVEAGSNVIQGVAMDPTAPAGSTGVDRVDFFLGNRDEGGIALGSVVPGMVPGPFGPGSFQTTVDFPTGMIGGHDLFAYAHDSTTGQESVISETISVGEDTTKAFVTPPSDTQTQTCLGTAATPASPMTSTTTPAAPTSTNPTTTTAQTSTTTTTTTATTPSTQTITLEVGNPSAGDTIHAGAYKIIGTAWDKAATSGSGIDRIDIFLDNRDEGGMMLGSATLLQDNMWTATVTIPNNQLGLHTLWFYAHSSASGQEATQSIPVTTAL